MGRELVWLQALLSDLEVVQLSEGSRDSTLVLVGSP